MERSKREIQIKTLWEPKEMLCSRLSCRVHSTMVAEIFVYHSSVWILRNGYQNKKKSLEMMI